MRQNKDYESPIVTKMKNKKFSKFALLFLIGVTALVLTTSTSFKNAPTSLALATSSSLPFKTFSLGERYGTRHDTDIFGNQIYTWSNDGAIFYQRFNQTGEILSGIKSVATTGNNSSPDVTFTQTGFAITWLNYNDTSGLWELKMSSYTHTDGTFATDILVSDTLMNYDAKPRISSNNHSNDIGITWEQCENPSCDSHDIAFKVYDHNGNTLSPGTLIVNTTTSENQTNPDIAASLNAYYITWLDFEFRINSRGYFNQGNDSTEVIMISPDDSNYRERPSIAATITEDYLGTSEDNINPDDLLNEFFITWTEASDIYARKVNCIINNIADQGNPGDYIDVLECTPESRGNEANFIRANSTEGSNSQPVISAYKPFNPIQRNRPYQDTALSIINISWINQGSTTNLLSQNFTDNLKRSGTEFVISTNINTSEPITSSSNADGFFTVNYSEGSFTNDSKTALIPSQYLRKGDQRLINAPDLEIENKPKVAVSNNGNYAIVYERDNGNNYDVILALYNSEGNPIKNNQIISTTEIGDQINPQISFFNEAIDSEHHGKFIVSWEGEGSGDSNGIFYQLFNADGEKIGTETLINDNTLIEQGNHKLQSGKYGQFGIAYTDNVLVPTSFKLFYNNNSNQFITTISNTIDSPVIHYALSPEADGSLGNTEKTKMVFIWDVTGSTENYVGSYLDTNTSISLGITTSINGDVLSIDGGYKEGLTNLTVPADPFFIVSSIINPSEDILNEVRAFTTNGVDTVISSIDVQLNSQISVDPNTGNYISYYADPGNTIYETRRNSSEAILLPAGSINTLYNGQTIFKNDYTTQATITNTQDYSAGLTSSTGAFNPGDQIGSFDTYYSTNSSPSTIIYFSNDISSNFILEQTVTGTTSGASGEIRAISNFYIVLEDVSGTFQNGETLDNSANDTIDYSENTLNLYFSSFEGYYFPNGSSAINSDLSIVSEVLHSNGDFISVENTNFHPGGATEGNVSKYTPINTVQSDTIGVIQGQIYSLSIERINGNEILVTRKFGPEFSFNQYKIYGQSSINPSVDYNTSSTNKDEKVFVSAFASDSSSSTLMLDGNGIYHQIFEDPFSLGTKEDLSPITEQQISAGGKYIVVPQNIDFGTIARSSTGTVNFADLTPSCLQVTDLDGTDFDLTVSLTDLVNSENPLQIIPNDNFVIENNDGINPLIQTSYDFSQISDVTLDPSTSPGENANLNSNKTLLKKSNTNTGSWTICPTVKLTVQSDATSGNYNGILTFTLI